MKDCKCCFAVAPMEWWERPGSPPKGIRETPQAFQDGRNDIELNWRRLLQGQET